MPVPLHVIQHCSILILPLPLQGPHVTQFWPDWTCPLPLQLEQSTVLIIEPEPLQVGHFLS